METGVAPEACTRAAMEAGTAARVTSRSVLGPSAAYGQAEAQQKRRQTQAG